MLEQPNLQYIKDLSGGDVEFEEKMLLILKEEFPEELKTYNLTLEINELKQTAEIVHKLKHKISILGLEKSYELAVEYEKELLKGNNSMHSEFSEILKSISNFLAK